MKTISATPPSSSPSPNNIETPHCHCHQFHQPTTFNHSCPVLVTKNHTNQSYHQLFISFLIAIQSLSFTRFLSFIK